MYRKILNYRMTKGYVFSNERKKGDKIIYCPICFIMFI